MIEERTVRVRCTYELDVKIPAEWDYYLARFSIEDDGCPGTGTVGAALDEHIEKHGANGTCWACALGGKNELLTGEWEDPASAPKGANG